MDFLLWKAKVVSRNGFFESLYQEHRCSSAVTQRYHLKEPRYGREFGNTCWLTVQHKSDSNRRLNCPLSDQGILQHDERYLHLISDSGECSLAVRGLLACLLAPEFPD